MSSTPDRWQSRLPEPTLATVAGVVLVLSLMYLAWWGSAPVVHGDSASYLDVAEDLRDGDLDVLHDRTLGYPAVLVLVGGGETPGPPLVVVQLMMHGATVLGAVALSRRFGIGSGATWVLVACLMSPAMVEGAFYVMTETPTAFVLTLGTLLAIRSWESGRLVETSGAGTCFAAAALLRPTYLLLAPLIVLVGLAIALRRTDRRRALRVGSALAAGPFILLGGLVAYNATTFSAPTFTPMLGWNLTTRTAPFIEDLPDEHAAVREVLVRRRDEQLVSPGSSHSGRMYVWGIRDEVAAAAGRERPALDSYMLRLNAELIARRPLNYLQAVVENLPSYFLPSTTSVASQDRTPFELALAVLNFLIVGAFFLQLLFLTGAFRLRRRLGAGEEEALERALPTWLVATGVIGYTLVVSALFDVGNPRYRTPVDPLMVVLAVGGGALALSIWRSARLPVPSEAGSTA